MAGLAYLGLGSNMGDRRRNMAEAVKMLEGSGHVRVERVSSLYETEPVGYTEQGRFLNAVVAITCGLPPLRLLQLCQGIEASLGRERTIRWGPRTIDIDILLYFEGRPEAGQDCQALWRGLEIPHPRMWERGFVVIPLAEIAPDLKAPSGLSAGDLARDPATREGVALYMTGPWWQDRGGEGGAREQTGCGGPRGPRGRARGGGV